MCFAADHPGPTGHPSHGAGAGRSRDGAAGLCPPTAEGWVLCVSVCVREKIICPFKLPNRCLEWVGAGGRVRSEASDWLLVMEPLQPIEQ